MATNQSFIDKLVNSPGYKSFIKKLLIFALAATIVGLVGQFLFHVESMDTLVIMGMGTLAVNFFLKAYEQPKSLSESREDRNQPVQNVGLWASGAFAKFVQKLYGWGLAVVIVGLLFFLEHWPGWTSMLILGIPTGILAVTFKLISNKARSN